MSGRTSDATNSIFLKIHNYSTQILRGSKYRHYACCLEVAASNFPVRNYEENPVTARIYQRDPFELQMELHVPRGTQWEVLQVSNGVCIWLSGFDLNYTMYWRRTRFKRVIFTLSDI